MEVSVARKAKKIERTLRTDSHPIAHTAAVVLLFLDNLPPSTSYLRAGALTLLGLGPLDAPVEDVVVLVALANEEVAEELTEVRVVGLVVEAEGTSVVQEDPELVGETAAEEVGGSGHLLLHDAVVLLLLRGRLKALPWKGATAEVEHDIAEGFHVVAAGLLWG